MFELEFIDDSKNHSVPTQALQRNGDKLIAYIWEITPSAYEFEYRAPNVAAIVDITDSLEDAMVRVLALANTLEQVEGADTAPRGWEVEQSGPSDDYDDDDCDEETTVEWLERLEREDELIEGVLARDLDEAS